MTAQGAAGRTTVIEMKTKKTYILQVIEEVRDIEGIRTIILE